MTVIHVPKRLSPVLALLGVFRRSHKCQSMVKYSQAEDHFPHFLLAGVLFLRWRGFAALPEALPRGTLLDSRELRVRVGLSFLR